MVIKIMASIFGVNARRSSISVSLQTSFVVFTVVVMGAFAAASQNNINESAKTWSSPSPVSSSLSLQVHINLPETATIVHQVDKRFLSIAIDSYQLKLWWQRINFTDERLCMLTKYLQPAYLRIGGTTADIIQFASGSPPGAGIHLLQLGEFLNKTKLDLIFGLNVMLRNKTHWNSSNAFELMTFMSKHRIPVAGWELGNEPNQFPLKFNMTVQPKRIAKDFSRLRRLLQKFDLYKDSLLIGPDTTNPDTLKYLKAMEQMIQTNSVDPSNLNGPSGWGAAKFLRSFLKHIDPQSLDRVSFHQYFFNGPTATIADFLNTTIMNRLKYEINLGKFIINKTITPGKLIWLGETSTAWSGGTPNVSNAFVSVFSWLDKLGQSALNGVDVVIRQDLLGQWYGVIDTNGDPTPNYFVSLLYKRFVGEQVLSTHSWLSWFHQNKSHLINSNNNNRSGSSRLYEYENLMRPYAHCAKINLHQPTRLGAVALYIVNPTNHSFLVQVAGRAGVFIEEYLLQAPHQNLMSTNVNMNGKLLRIDPITNKYPVLQPVVRTREFNVPGYSVGFWILKYSNVQACKSTVSGVS